MAICLSDAGGHHPPTESRPSAASYRRTAHVHRLMDAHRQENCADSYRWSPRLVEAENVRVPPGASDYCVSLPCKRFFTVFNVVLNLFIANAIAYVDAGSPVGFAGFKGPRDTGSRPPNLYFRQHTHPDSFQDGPLLGAPQGPAGVSAGVLKDYHNSSGYEPGALVAHSMLMLTEMLLGVSLLAALLSEAVFIVGSKKQQERRWWIYLLVMLLCCWFAVGLCCFYCTSTTSNNAALNGSSAAQPRGTAALGTPATGTSFDGFETQQPQHQRFGSSPLLQARSGFDEGTGENREKTEESVTFGKSATAQEDVLPLSRTTPGHKQYSQLHSLQAGDWHQQEREIPFTPFSHLKSLQPITNLQSDVSNEHSYSTVKGMWKAAAPIAAKGTDMEGAPQRRLSASLWDSGTATLYLKSVNEFDNTGAEKNSRSTNTSTGAAGLLLRATAAVHKGVTGIIILCNTVLNWVGDALGALLLCSILVPPLLLRLTAFFVTLDLVRHQDALIQRRDSTQKNSVYWLVVFVCLSSAQMLPLFIWVELARHQGWNRWLPERGIDPLLLLHLSSSLALYVHLRKGCFRLSRKGLIKSIASAYSTFDLVSPYGVLNRRDAVT
ncbi:hypothetical protein cyc_00446 [Cyclospora cayetanensis]|uniref:Transmembrane protein n=1 Tax=Cyclospora cayetanensis TaxID=88456 RepID=A0A1D3D4T1_9EIME|nr:hypothetical protein cyc_00446 [Cyclospora cayetanensis]